MRRRRRFGVCEVVRVEELMDGVISFAMRVRACER